MLYDTADYSGHKILTHTAAPMGGINSLNQLDETKEVQEALGVYRPSGVTGGGHAPGADPQGGTSIISGAVRSKFRPVGTTITDLVSKVSAHVPGARGRSGLVSRHRGATQSRIITQGAYPTGGLFGLSGLGQTGNGYTVTPLPRISSGGADIQINLMTPKPEIIPERFKAKALGLRAEYEGMTQTEIDFAKAMKSMKPVYRYTPPVKPRRGYQFKKHYGTVKTIKPRTKSRQTRKRSFETGGLFGLGQDDSEDGFELKGRSEYKMFEPNNLSGFFDDVFQWGKKTFLPPFARKLQIPRVIRKFKVARVVSAPVRIVAGSMVSIADPKAAKRMFDLKQTELVAARILTAPVRAAVVAPAAALSPKFARTALGASEREAEIAKVVGRVGAAAAGVIFIGPYAWGLAKKGAAFTYKTLWGGTAATKPGLIKGAIKETGVQVASTAAIMKAMPGKMAAGMLEAGAQDITNIIPSRTDIEMIPDTMTRSDFYGQEQTPVYEKPDYGEPSQVAKTAAQKMAGPALVLGGGLLLFYFAKG